MQRAPPAGFPRPRPLSRAGSDCLPALAASHTRSHVHPHVHPSHTPPCAAADYTNTFRALSGVRTEGAAAADDVAGLPAALAAALGPLDEVRGPPACWAACASPLVPRRSCSRIRRSPSQPAPSHLGARPASSLQERYADWRDWLALYRSKLAAEGLPHAERAAMQARSGAA